LQETAERVRTAEDWNRCLQAAARLPGQSWANVLLISSRVPDATLVKGYEAWRSADRQVSRAEKGIEIFSLTARPAASRQDDEPDRSWRDAARISYVWDLSQTGGQPLSGPAVTPALPGEVPPGLWDCLCWLARREGFAIERESGCPADGTTFWTARRIRVLPGPADGQAVWALTHQLGHVLLHNTTATPPGSTTSGCEGIRKAEADSVAFITCARLGIQHAHVFAHPPTWAGTDPRAQPGAALLVAGERITVAARKISRYLDQQLPRGVTGRTSSARVEAAPKTPTAVASPAEPDPKIQVILQDAETFFTAQLASSWVSAYLRQRGLTAEAAGEWRIGYAPGGWTTLVTHLRGRGHHDDAIRAAGLARISSRGTLIDHFRDRVMLPVHDQHGNLAGFTARSRPDSGPGIPKYLNTPQTSVYKKGNLLFGLYQARDRLARGAIPVIAEGPFDAIAITLAGRGRYVGLAPCGTALTSPQAEALSRAADLRGTGILVAFDDDPAGRKAAVRAYHVLHAISDRLQAVALPGKDPAEILESAGPSALHAILRNHLRPLSALVIDAHLSPWQRRLRDTEGPLLAMRSVATVIAELLPAETATAIRRFTGGREVATLDEHLRPVADPALPQLADALPADTAFQITYTAERLGFTDYSDVLAEVANAVIRRPAVPQGTSRSTTGTLSEASFPRPSLAPGRQQSARIGPQSRAKGPARSAQP
jgi:DNA primase